MREFFRSTKFRTASLELIGECNRIIEDYVDAGLRLTLRQLYYQLVSANLIPNEEKSYKNLGKLVSNARLAGMMDWDAIEDRVRQARAAAEWESVRDSVEEALYTYRLPRLQDQPEYVELWVEKDALAGVLEPIAGRYHVVLMVNRGYSSQSAMYESARRIEENCEKYNCGEATILYLGDLDPSGEDMVRDISDRMEMFGCFCEVEKVALNIDQVRDYNLPPNPAKLSDSRAAAFIAKYGASSWEVDALPPRVLQQIISDAVESRLDMNLMDEVKRKETEDKKRLREMMASL